MALPVGRRAARSAALREQFFLAWDRSDKIIGIVESHASLARPIAFRHPFLFYVGHLPAFAWNQICGGVLRKKSINPHFDNLFSRGIDPDVETGECHAHPEVPRSWPQWKAVLDYRDKVRSAVLASFDAVLERGPRDLMAENGRVFSMVLEHEYMHQETLLYMIQEAAPELKRRFSEAMEYHDDRPPEVRTRSGRKLGERARRRILDAFDNRRGLARTQRLPWPFPTDLTRQALYRLRDESGLSRQEFFVKHFGASGEA